MMNPLASCYLLDFMNQEVVTQVTFRETVRMGGERGFSGLSWFQRFKRHLPHSNEKYLLNATIGKPSLFLSSFVFWSSKKRAKVRLTNILDFLFTVSYFKFICNDCLRKIWSVPKEEGVDWKPA